MWTYNYTPSSDELYHRSHKYIKREWKNGHYVYYYDEKSNNLTGLKEKRKSLENERHRAFMQYHNDNKLRDYAQAKNAQERKNVQGYYAHPGLNSHAEYAYNYGDYHPYERDDRGLEYTKKIEKTTSDINKYSKTPKGKVDSFMEKNGNKIVSKLNMTDDKKNKVISKISKILNKKVGSQTSSASNKPNSREKKIGNGTVKAKKGLTVSIKKSVGKR